jgi:hypothetical protein
MDKDIRSSGREKQILLAESFLKAQIFVFKLGVVSCSAQNCPTL